MNGIRSNFRRIVVLACFLGFTIFVVAPSAFADSPTTRAARLTYMQGTVSVTEPSNGETVPAQPNLPLVSGVQLSTGEDGQAEIEFEDGSVVRLTPNSALSLDNLAVDPAGVFITDLGLLHGLAYVELRATQQYRYSLNAGGDIVSPVENTTVRVNFDEPPAVFAVLDGTAHVDRQNSPNGEMASSGYQADVRAGESLRPDPADPSRYFLTQGIDSDTWDQWNEDLDQTEAAQSASSTDVRNNYAGAQGYGWSDLDASGNWYNVPGVGSVWQPEQAYDDAGFDPYGNGSRVAYPGVGYVWASAYPWGWTPYRCGNWSYYGGFGWGWAPGGGCGGLGWVFAGGGRPVNIVGMPPGYRPVHVPVPGHGPQRPWIPVRSGNAPVVATRPADHGLRQIAGVTASPVKRVGNAFNSGEAATGAPLRRDFPVDTKTRQPVMGLASTRPATVYTNPARNGGDNRQANPETPGAGRQQPSNQRPAGNPQYRQFPANQQPGASQVQRPVDQQSVPVQRNTPPQQQPDHRSYVPQTQPQQPAPPQRNYTPPPAQQPQQPEHRNYAPPPAQAAPHPSYTPPPAPPPPSHPNYTPPPAPPPQPSAPPAQSNSNPRSPK